MNELACLKAVIDADPIRYLDLTQPLARGTGQVVDADAVTTTPCPPRPNSGPPN